MVKSELDAGLATGTWGADEEAFCVLELCRGSKELLAASVLPLPSERIIVEVAGAHACLSVLITEGPRTQAYRARTETEKPRLEILKERMEKICCLSSGLVCQRKFEEEMGARASRVFSDGYRTGVVDAMYPMQHGRSGGGS